MIYEQSQYLIGKATYLYYYDGKSQEEISKILNVSISTVSRLLKMAKENGFIKIKMDEDIYRAIELSNIILKNYDLKDVIIAPVSGEEDLEEIKKLTALEGARYIQRIIKKSDILGVAWGGTMYYVINFLNPSQRIKSRFVTLHSSIYTMDYKLDATTLVKKIAKAFSGSYKFITANSLMSSSSAIDLLKEEENISEIFDIYNDITISLSGIGSLYPEVTSPLGELIYINEEELSILQEAGAYGDLILRFFDKDGEECDTPLKDRTLAIDFETYKNIPNKIVVASGNYKLETIKAALKGKLIDTLIIDSNLAEELCKEL